MATTAWTKVMTSLASSAKVVQTVLGERRQYVQTMLFEVAKSKSLYFVLAPKYRATLNFFELLLRMVEEARKLASN